MQNKHYFFFPFWESQRSGRGGVGGQAGWAKIPTFTENLFWRLPLPRNLINFYGKASDHADAHYPAISFKNFKGFFLKYFVVMYICPTKSFINF